VGRRRTRWTGPRGTPARVARPVVAVSLRKHIQCRTFRTRCEEPRSRARCLAQSGSGAGNGRGPGSRRAEESTCSVEISTRCEEPVAHGELELPHRHRLVESADAACGNARRRGHRRQAQMDRRRGQEPRARRTPVRRLELGCCIEACIGPFARSQLPRLLEVRPAGPVASGPRGTRTSGRTQGVGNMGNGEGREAQCLRLAAKQLGVIRRDQALQSGLTKRQLAWRVGTGRWRHVLPRVYRIEGTPETWHQRLRPFACGRRRSFLSHDSAAAPLASAVWGPGLSFISRRSTHLDRLDRWTQFVVVSRPVTPGPLRAFGHWLHAV
jgi:hypothetical protein